ncbi:MAG TPA: hypothetical protein VK278_01260 [Gaiellaceae bacterium]|nr:hypothetical protein [Gaiellaceae bacterium]
MAETGIESAVGEVTGRIAPGTIGEVMIAIRGGREAFHADAFDAGEVIDVGTEAVVVERVGPRSVKVARMPGERGAPSPWSLQSPRS